MSLISPASIFENIYIKQIAPDDGATTTIGLAAGTTDKSSVAVDAQGFESISFLVIFGDNANTGTFAGKIQGSADGSTGWTDISDTGASFSITAGASDTDYAMMGVWCKVKTYPYYRFYSDRGTANTVILTLLAFLNGARQRPVTQPTTAPQFYSAPTS